MTEAIAESVLDGTQAVAGEAGEAGVAGVAGVAAGKIVVVQREAQAGRRLEVEIHPSPVPGLTALVQLDRVRHYMPGRVFAWLNYVLHSLYIRSCRDPLIRNVVSNIQVRDKSGSQNRNLLPLAYDHSLDGRYGTRGVRQVRRTFCQVRMHGPQVEQDSS